MKGNGKPEINPLKERLHELIFEADTPTGKWFDIILLILILASVLAVILESVPSLDARYHNLFITVEWLFTIVFTIEYILRLYCVYKPWKYATSFFGIVDLLAILPTYLSILFYQSHYLTVIRALRLLRVFRIFKLAKYSYGGKVILVALRQSRAKITVFLTFVILMTTLIGSLMYVIEGGTNDGFRSIPQSIYWAIVTLTTVGFGDITPQTPLGRFFSAMVMILGYAVIAVPTGIVSAELASVKETGLNTQTCRYCSKDGHDDDAEYCKFCGEILNEPES